MPRDISPQTLESSALLTFPWLPGGLVVSLPLLLLTQANDRRWEAMIHLSLLVLFLFALSWRLGRSGDHPWFADRGWSESRRRLVTNVALIIILTGVAVVVTLASSAAMRYQPSLQFPQLLSALESLGLSPEPHLPCVPYGETVPPSQRPMMSIIYVLSIGLYLAAVGLFADQGRLVDGEQILRLVLPFDVAAAAITIGLTVSPVGCAQETEQASAQSYDWNEISALPTRSARSGSSHCSIEIATARFETGTQVGMRCGRTKSAPYQRKMRESSSRCRRSSYLTPPPARNARI